MGIVGMDYVVMSSNIR